MLMESWIPENARLECFRLLTHLNEKYLFPQLDEVLDFSHYRSLDSVPLKSELPTEYTQNRHFQ